MYTSFISTLSEYLSEFSTPKLLLAVSGGVDSMVMLDILSKSDFTIGVAHIDHHTRNGQSTKDATFVRNYCEERVIPCHISVFEKSAAANNNFQAAAREYRYAYFNGLLEEHGYTHMLTAHHQDDRWESLVHNLSKSAGIDGLSTLRYGDQNLIRPLLDFRKKEIVAYAHECDIPFVHDISNESDDYTRNKIRHHITPAIEGVFPEIVKSATESMHYLDQDRLLIEELIAKSGVVTNINQYLTIDLIKVNAFKNAESLLYRIVKQDGFTRSDAKDMLQSETGAVFYTAAYEALHDRGNLLIRKRKAIGDINQLVTVLGDLELANNRIIKVSNKSDGSDIIPGLTLPFTIRNWQAGDTFQPLGMDGKKKKVKAYLNDKKLSKWDKAEVLVVEKENMIWAVLGHRLSHISSSIKVDEHTISVFLKRTNV